MYSKITDEIRVSVVPTYLVEHSSPEEEHYVWAYTIQLENLGARTAQLMSRYWHITDGRGQVQQVHGPGVVGQQPVLKPGKSYKYTSSAALTTPSGIMTGHYEMVRENGERFTIAIPTFSLDSPYQVARPN